MTRCVVYGSCYVFAERRACLFSRSVSVSDGGDGGVVYFFGEFPKRVANRVPDGARTSRRRQRVFQRAGHLRRRRTHLRRRAHLHRDLHLHLGKRQPPALAVGRREKRDG